MRGDAKCSCWSDWWTDNFYMCTNCKIDNDERQKNYMLSKAYEPKRPRSWFMPHAKPLIGPKPERHWPEAEISSYPARRS